MPSIAVSTFVRRQTPESEFSHFDGSWDELRELVEANFETGVQGYRDGVKLIPVPPQRFFANVVELKEGDRFAGVFKRRRPEEEPRSSIGVVGGQKSAAQYVEVVLYRADVLEEDGDRTTDADWEIVSINANPIPKKKMPMKPGTLIANHFHLSGGTKTKMTAKQFEKALKKSVKFWTGKATLAPPEATESVLLGEEERDCVSIPAQLEIMIKTPEVVGPDDY